MVYTFPQTVTRSTKFLGYRVGLQTAPYSSLASLGGPICKDFIFWLRIIPHIRNP